MDFDFTLPINSKEHASYVLDMDLDLIVNKRKLVEMLAHHNETYDMSIERSYLEAIIYPDLEDQLCDYLSALHKIC